MIEEWKLHSSGYEVSNKGRVKTKFGRIRVLAANTCGYIACNINGKKEYVHRLVAETFLPPSNNKIINHKNGTKTDNNVKNLEWTTLAGNNKHARETGLNNVKGSNSPSAKLTELQVKEIRNLRKKNVLSNRKIAKKFGVCHTTINHIIHRKMWNHV